MKLKIATLLSLIVLLLFSVSARADTTYTYAGNPMTNGATPDVCGGGPCTITGSFTLATPLGDNVPFSYTPIAPVSFSFTDGIETIASGSASVLYFDVGTDASGNINAWDIQVYGLYDGTVTILTVSVPGSAGLDENYSNGLLIYNTTPGLWDPETVRAVTTPEPRSLPLLSSGLFAVALLALRKRQLKGRYL